MFKFNIIQESNISKLAWLLVIEKDFNRVHLYCGSSVETSSEHFVEGVWNSKFEDLNFENASFFCGSGGKFIDNKIYLSTASHVLERLYSLKVSNNLYFSNSLPFILQRSNSNLAQNFYNYEEYFSSILNGLDKYKTKIPLENNRILNVYYYSNICIDDSLCVKQEFKCNRFKLDSYETYLEEITKCVEYINLNAQSSKRHKRYTFVTTISSGYDAPTCAYLAKKSGCRIAVTLNKPEQYKNDSGEEIAKKLGYKEIILGDGNDYKKRNDLIEAEYISSGELGSGIVFNTFEKVFKGKVVFVGERGDKIWSKNTSFVNNKFRFNNELFAATSQIENRLANDYFLVPLPLFAAENWEAINNISNSDQMSLYSIGGGYDRPIPRRILEEEGVPRNMFGINKVGAGFNYRFDNDRRLKSRLSPKSYESYNNYCKINKLNKLTLKKLILFLKFLYDSRFSYLNYFFYKLNLPLKANQKEVKLTSNPCAPLNLFRWSIYIMKEKYK